MMKEEFRQSRVETVPRARMTEVLRVAAELYEQEQSRIARDEEAHQMVQAALEVGLPADILERAAAIVAEREAEREAASRKRKQRRDRMGAVMAMSVVAGLTTAGWTLLMARRESAPAPPPPAVAAAVATPLLGPCTEVDLSPFVTQRLDESMLPTPGNHLGTLLVGQQEGGATRRILNGVPFRLDGVVLVGPGETTSGAGDPIATAPQIEGIAIDRKVKRLHFLHGTHWRVGDGTKIGAYIVHYANGTRQEIPIRYGEDVLDWWETSDRRAGAIHAKVAWNGRNEASARHRSGIRLFMRSWENPYPEQPIASLDMVTGEQAAGRSAPAPFLVGLTLEDANRNVRHPDPQRPHR